MTDRVDLAKLHPTFGFGPPVSVVSVPKLVAYFLLEPNSSEPGETTSQGHVYVQIVGGF